MAEVKIKFGEKYGATAHFGAYYNIEE